MLQAQLANDFCRRLGRDAANLMEERHTSHAHGRSHLVEADLSAAHVLQHELLHIAHQLLVHQVVHAVVADGVAVVVFGQHVVLADALHRLFCLGSFGGLGSLGTAGLHLDGVHVVVDHRRRRHAGILTFQHTRLLALDDVLVELYRSQTQQLVETHHGLLHVERLGQIVVGSQRDVLVGHVLFGQHIVGQQHELGLVPSWVRLELVAKLAARHGSHVLFADDDVGIQRLDVGQRILNIIIGMEVVDVAQMGIHEVQEFLVVVDKHYAELLRLLVHLQRLHVESQIPGTACRQGYLAVVVQLQLVLGTRLSLLLRILQRALHLRDAGDDLQHLEVERVQLLTAFQRLFALCHVADDGCHAGHGLAQLVAGQLDFLALALQLLNDGLLAQPYRSELLDAITPYGQNQDGDDDIDAEHPPRQPPGTVDDNLERTLLVADSTVGADCLDVQDVLAAAQVVELNAVQ